MMLCRPMVVAVSLWLGVSGGVAIAQQGPAVSKARQDLQARAAGSNLEAKRDLGLDYLFGKHGPAAGEQAERWLQEAAKQNDAAAQVALGFLYEDGKLLGKSDMAKAIQWYTQAAEHDHPVAQARLGRIYRLGVGGKKDYTLAAKWLAKAASWGDANAQASVAEMYETGQGIAQNYSLAATWYSAAAAQKHGPSQWRLGYLYENGLGVNKDYVKAYMWYSIAGVWEMVGDGDLAAGDPRRALAEKMTPVQIIEAESQATDWWVEHFQAATE
ncbi:MAG: sel1 repeat family protein [Gammaproteobacteria bacterium]|nr:sel1 repeat family protein [Gammaproteobacteria bacterium]